MWSPLLSELREKLCHSKVKNKISYQYHMDWITLWCSQEITLLYSTQGLMLSSLCSFRPFLSVHQPQPLHSSSLKLVGGLWLPILLACVCSRGPKSSSLLELGPCLRGWRAGGCEALAHVASHKYWTLAGVGRSGVHTVNEVAATQTFSWQSHSLALILIQPSAFSTGCHCWPA